MDHNILINDFEYYGFRGTTNLLIESYLQDRMLSTGIYNELSEEILSMVYLGDIIGIHFMSITFYFMYKWYS